MTLPEFLTKAESLTKADATDAAPRTVALIGAGAMGGAIGARLAQTGTILRVFDRNPAQMAPLSALGATATASAAEAATGASAIILSLNAPQIVHAAVFGPGGVAEGAAPGTLIIDMSSIDPTATQDLAREAGARGLRWVDSPLSGGAPKAATGQLTLMQGGAPGDVAEAQQVLARVAANQTRMGDAGAGQTTKLINQVLCGLNFLAVAEATALAEAAGVDAAAIPAALAGGRADSAILQEYMPRFSARDYRPTGRIDNMVKDLNGAQDLARLSHTPMPLTALCAEVHRLLTAKGLGDQDQAALMEFFPNPLAREATR
ncbi:NAD(P)-dependent oxidoreductase [Paracoccus nototheniae]|uniref:NAD(P)-dependent oxidoreductase n=1 Tax=Paracoccus nototheniae TaxID=2489002 RepID=A0ABW4DZ90_9RHOB|nr:NAD(P)-dependent oxidoreductase [Paracoccus nototheniae]